MRIIAARLGVRLPPSYNSLLSMSIAHPLWLPVRGGLAYNSLLSMSIVLSERLYRELKLLTYNSLLSMSEVYSM